MVLFRKKKESCDVERLVQLTIVQGDKKTDDLPGKVFELQCGNNIIGRDPVCEIILNSETVSRRHANIKVSYDKKKFTIIDLGSSNGIIIKPSILIRNNKKPLNSGSEIQIGEVLLKFLAIDQDESLQTLTVDMKNIMQDKPSNEGKKE